MASLHGLRLGLALALSGILRAPGDLALAASAELDRGSVPPSERLLEASRYWAEAPDLALARVYAPGTDLSAYLASEKLDGVRAYWDGQRLITRGGRVVQTPVWFTLGFPSVPLDGELWMGRGNFAALSGAVRRLEPDPDDWTRIRYVLFDLPTQAGDFSTRQQRLRTLMETSPSPFLCRVEQFRLANHDGLMRLLEQVTAAGGEGLMLHRRDAHYRSGRSADRLKVKAYEEGEARVIAHLPGRGRHLGRLGALLVEEPDGIRFRLGTGFSDAERSQPPPIGSIVTFKHHGRTAHGRPRFASFLRLGDRL